MTRGPGDPLRSRDIFGDEGPPPEPFSPPSVPGYELEEPIGRGGMGIVYRATQLQPRREVAVKVLRCELASERARARFRREVELLARVRHRAVVRITGAGTSDEGAPYYAMELVEGLSWNEFLEQRQPDLRERLALFLQVCEGVAFLHEEGILHRDLKPGNLRVDRQTRARILDFGLARTVAGAEAEITRPGEPLGTSQYMSPEQWQDSSSIDERSDVYSLGVILYELLGGTLCEDLVSSQDQWREEHSLRVRAHRELPIDEDLRSVVERALEIDPELRIPDPGELALEIRRYLTDRPVLSRRTPASRRARLFLRRHATALRPLAAIGILIAGLSWSSVHEWRRAVEYQRSTEARVRQTLEVCGFVIDELGEGRDHLGREELSETLTEVLGALRSVREIAHRPVEVAALTDRARRLLEELGPR